MFDIIVFCLCISYSLTQIPKQMYNSKTCKQHHCRFQVEAFDAIEAGCVEKIGWQNSVSLWDVSFFSGNVFTKHVPNLLGLVAS